MCVSLSLSLPQCDNVTLDRFSPSPPASAPCLCRPSTALFASSCRRKRRTCRGCARRIALRAHATRMSCPSLLHPSPPPLQPPPLISLPPSASPFLPHTPSLKRRRMRAILSSVTFGANNDSLDVGFFRQQERRPAHTAAQEKYSKRALSASVDKRPGKHTPPASKPILLRSCLFGVDDAAPRDFYFFARS